MTRKKLYITTLVFAVLGTMISQNAKADCEPSTIGICQQIPMVVPVQTPTRRPDNLQKFKIYLPVVIR